MIKVLYLGPKDGLSTVCEALGTGYEILSSTADSRDVEKVVSGVSSILDASMKVPFTRSLLEKADHLRLFAAATTGSDHIAADYLAEKGIPLLTLKGQKEILQNLTPAAELSWLLLMALARRIRPAIHHVEQGLWSREFFPGMMLKGRTLGLIGLGRIGGWMSRYAQAFGMTVCAYDPYQQEWPENVQRCSFDELLGKCDFLSIHVHASEKTKGLLNKAAFQKIKPGTMLINTSRGSIVEESALLEALDSKVLAGYGCDVVEGEPAIKETALWNYAQAHDQVVITPHIGGFSPDALGVVLRFTAGRIREHFQAGN
jgi:D-3-phosphoglycerate dehydrogenase